MGLRTTLQSKCLSLQSIKGGRGRMASFSERLLAGSQLLSVQGVKVGEEGG